MDKKTYEALEKVAPEIKQKALEIVRLFKQAWPEGKYLSFAYVSRMEAGGGLYMDCDQDSRWTSPLDWRIEVDRDGNEVRRS